MAEAAAIDDLIDEVDQLLALDVSKISMPLPSGTITFEEPITYTIQVSNTGDMPVDNLVITDTIPTGTNLITYAVNQGNIIVDNNTLIATIGRFYPLSDTVVLTAVVSASFSPLITDTVLSNQAFINSDPIIKTTNIITHNLVNQPELALSKTARPYPSVEAGQILTYTVSVTVTGLGYGTSGPSIN